MAKTMTSTSKPAHSRFAPSSAHRWTNCPASMTLEAAAPQSPGSVFAQEGSAAHKLSEMRLMGVLTAVGLTQAQGKWMKDLVPETDPERETYDYLDIMVDGDMIEHVQEFLIWINTQVPEGYSTLNRDVVLAEEQVVTAIDDEIAGTCDVIIMDVFETLHVVDLKYGQGKQVDADDNPQLAIYALGAIEEFGDDFETVKMTIYQPRGAGPTVKTWEMPIRAFIDKWTKIIAKGHMQALMKTQLFRPGDWCKWCRGALECGRAKRATNDMAKPTAVVPRDIKAVARILQTETAVLEYLNQCKAKAFEALSRGDKVPGFKLVRNFGQETWTDVERVLGILGGHANDDTPAAKIINFPKAKPKTPKQVRKALGDDYPDSLNDLAKCPDKGLILVPETDKRQAYEGAAEDFADDPK